MRILVTLLLAVLIAPFARAEAAESAGDNHLLTIAVCPPWKKGEDAKQTALMGGACKTTVGAIEASFQNDMGVAKDKTYSLLNDGAKYADVAAKFAWLNENTGADDTLYIYLLAHGGHLQGHYKGYPVTDQGIAFWSEKEPDLSVATDEKIFMLVRTFRDMMDSVKVKNIVLIVDSCHSGASFNDFKNDPHAQSASAARTAVVLSAKGDQFANFNADYTMPLFSEMLSHSLKVSAGQPLSDAVELADTAAHRRLRVNCATPAVKKMLKEASDLSYYSLCTQRAEVYDPTGLMDEITVE